MVKKSREKAVALGYDPKSDSAPRLLASGSGKTAEKIISVAKAHGIPIHEDADLVEVLGSLKIKEEIPPDLYLVISEILAFIYRANGTALDGNGR